MLIFIAFDLFVALVVFVCDLVCVAACLFCVGLIVVVGCVVFGLVIVDSCGLVSFGCLLCLFVCDLWFTYCADFVFNLFWV